MMGEKTSDRFGESRGFGREKTGRVGEESGWRWRERRFWIGWGKFGMAIEKNADGLKEIQNGGRENFKLVGAKVERREKKTPTGWGGVHDTQTI